MIGLLKTPFIGLFAKKSSKNLTESLIDNDTPHVDKTYSSQKTEDRIAEEVASLVDSSPATLNTLKELADALGDDANFTTTITTQIGTKANNSDLTTETQNRIDGDVLLQQNVNTEASVRQTADNTLNAQYLAEVTVRQQTDNNLQSQISTEVTNRQSADTGLQSQITSLSNTKVDKITEKSLSTNDFDNTYKAKLDNVPTDTNAAIQLLLNDISTKVSQTDFDNLKAQIGLVADADSIVNTLYDIKQSLASLGENVNIATEFTNRYTKTQADTLLSSKQNIHPNLTSISQLSPSGNQGKMVVVKSDGSGFDLSIASSSSNYSSELLNTIKQTTFTSYIDIPLDLINYTNLSLISSNLVSDTDGVRMRFRLLDSNNNPITSAIYHLAGYSNDSAGNGWNEALNGGTDGTFTSNSGYTVRNEANNGELSLDVLITRPSSNKHFKLRSFASYTDTNARFMTNRIMNEVKLTSAISKIRIYATSGNIKGSLTLVGYKEKAADQIGYSTIPVLAKISQIPKVSTINKISNVQYYN